MGGTLSRWIACTASVIGSAHEASDATCQDFSAFARSGKTAAIALSDGAGSARFAAIGAKTAVESVLNLLGESFDTLYYMEPDKCRDYILGVLKRILTEHADLQGAQLVDFSCTLLFAAVNCGKYLLGHIGDGVICWEREGSWEIASKPTRGEFLNETYFITSLVASSVFSVRAGILDKSIRTISLMSDGSAEVLHQRLTDKIAPAIGTMANWLDRFPPDDVQLAIAENIRGLFREKTQDDCSIAIIRKVSVSVGSIDTKNKKFLLSYFGKRSIRAIRNIAEVARYIITDNGISFSYRSISENTGLHPNTVRRHVRMLKGLIDFD